MRSIYLRGGILAAVDHIRRVSVKTPVRERLIDPAPVNHAELRGEYQFVGRGQIVGSGFSPAIVVFGRHCVAGKRRRPDFIVSRPSIAVGSLNFKRCHASPLSKRRNFVFGR
jgi:hypothetical protein